MLPGAILHNVAERVYLAAACMVPIQKEYNDLFEYVVGFQLSAIGYQAVSYRLFRSTTGVSTFGTELPVVF